MKKFLTSDTAMKIYSILIALLIWGFVVITQNPISSKKINGLDVYCSNVDALEQSGLTILQNDEWRTSVEVRGKRLSIAKVDKTNTAASVTVPELKAGTYEVPIDIKLPLSDVYVSDKSAYTTKIVVEELATKEVPIQVTINGMSAEVRRRTKVELSSETIVLSGPRSVIDTVTSVSATINKSDVGKSVRSNIVVLNKDGQDITNNINLKLPFTAVKITATDMTSSPEKIEVSTSVDLEKGYDILRITCKPETVLIGTENKNSEVPTIKTEVIHIDKWTKTQTVEAELVIPDGYEVLDGTKTVEVTVEIEPVSTKEFTLKSKDINIEGKKSGFTYRLSEDSYPVTLRGMESLLEEKLELEGKIDVEGLKVGENTVQVDLTNKPDRVDQAKRVQVTVIVEEK